MYCLLNPKTHHLTSFSKSVVTKYEKLQQKFIDTQNGLNWKEPSRFSSFNANSIGRVFYLFNSSLRFSCSGALAQVLD